MPQTKEWTLMFYFASDNPLAASIVSQLKAIKDAGFHPEANVVARYDPHTEETPTHVFDVNRLAKLRDDGRSRVGFANDPYVRNLVLDKLWGDESDSDKKIRNRIKEALSKLHNGNGRGESGGHAPQVEFEMPVLPKEFSVERPPRESLQDFLDFCAKEYPARRYMLFILGHGVVVGNDFFLFDEHVEAEPSDEAAAGGAARDDEKKKGQNGAASPGDRRKRKESSGNALSLKGLGAVLRGFRKSIGAGSQFELLGLHSCSMSGLEVAYELRDTANYLLSSQGPAFVGSWPYKQILMRVFNDLNSPLTLGDLSDGRLAARLKEGGDDASKFLRDRLSQETRELLDRQEDPRRPELSLVRALARDLNRVLKDGTLLGGAPFDAEPGATPRPRAASARESRARLANVFEEIAAERKIAPVDVKEMVTKVFYYVLYNSYDFQLAGYSFDLCLCDLTKVSEAGEAVGRLAAALKDALAGGQGLAGGQERLGRELILLSHWDAQSFWQESYTDIYDFCLRLKRRCQRVFPELEALDGDSGQAGEAEGVMAEIVRACGLVMEKLERGAEGDDDRIIVRADFAGAEYQYSHGLSVFFPWARPGGKFFRQTYREEYEFALETSWGEFLHQYFTATQRETHEDENLLVAPRGVLRAAVVEPGGARGDGDLEKDVLEALLVEVGNRVFNDGQLDGPGIEKGGPDDPLGPGIEKGGPDDPLGPGIEKGGPDDPLGLGRVVAVFKNYPSFTGKSKSESPEEKGDTYEGLQSQPYSPTFFQGLRKS